MNAILTRHILYRDDRVKRIQELLADDGPTIRIGKELIKAGREQRRRLSWRWN